MYHYETKLNLNKAIKNRILRDKKRFMIFEVSKVLIS